MIVDINKITMVKIGLQSKDQFVMNIFTLRSINKYNYIKVQQLDVLLVYVQISLVYYYVLLELKISYHLFAHCAA